MRQHLGNIHFAPFSFAGGCQLIKPVKNFFVCFFIKKVLNYHFIRFPD